MRAGVSSGGLLLLLVLEAQQQHSTAQMVVPPIPNNGTCESMTVVYERVAALDAVCCAGGAEVCPGGAPLGCSVPCGAALSPLMNECGTILDMLFDAADGQEDGSATILRTLLSKCNALPASEVLAALKPLADAGRCPDQWMEGVGNVAVVADRCADSRVNCDALIGLLSCSDDFCHGTECSMHGECDKTCGLCGGGHRRAQVACDPEAFAAGASAVDTACCDDSAGCTGVPTECDARCGVIFVDFYPNCQSVLNAYSSTEDVDAYEQLNQTCGTEMPTAALLRLLGRCSTDPCAGVDCGQHGHCGTGGTCECLYGFAGPTCATDIDDCAPGPCLNGGTCTDAIGAYSCACAVAHGGMGEVGGYTGDNCQHLQCCSSMPCGGSSCSNACGNCGGCEDECHGNSICGNCGVGVCDESC